MKLAVCVALLCLAVSVKASGNCDIDPSRQVNCGAKTKEDCEAKNCCFDDNFVQGSGSFRCFHPKDPCQMPNPCLYGAQCVNKPTHSSYDDGAFECICPPGYPAGTNCRTRQGNCEVAAADRIACGLVNGFEGLVDNYDPGAICRSRGCCWNNSVKKTKWCFHPDTVSFPRCKCKGGY